MSVDQKANAFTSPRVKSLQQKHQELSDKIEQAQRNVSSPDHHISQLKKEKLLIKEKLSEEERLMATA